mgnify:CR=1 FL=1
MAKRPETSPVEKVVALRRDDTQAAADAQHEAGRFVHFPDSPFELFEPFPPAGDQPTAIVELVEGIRDGEMFQTLLETYVRQQIEDLLVSAGHLQHLPPPLQLP